MARLPPTLLTLDTDASVAVSALDDDSSRANFPSTSLKAPGYLSTDKEKNAEYEYCASKPIWAPNIHRDLNSNSWLALHNKLQLLKKLHPAIVISSFGSLITDDNGSGANPSCLFSLSESNCTGTSGTSSTNSQNDICGTSPLHTACWKAPPVLALEIIALLQMDHLDRRRVSRIALAVDSDGNTALHLCAANTCASDDVSDNDDDDVEGMMTLNLPTSTTASVATYKWKEVGVLDALVQLEPRALAIQNSQGDTPIHLAVSTPFASPEVLSTLIDNYTTDADDNIETCLTLQDSTGATPLHCAIANRANEEVLMTLLNSAPEATEVKDHQLMTPLHYIASFCFTPITFVKKVIAAYPDAIFQQSTDGDTPLHLLISNFSNGNDIDAVLSEQIAELLLGEKKNSEGGKACPLLIVNKEKMNPLHCCALFNSPLQLTKLLMEHSESAKAACMTNSLGATPLHLAVAQPYVGKNISTVLAIATPAASAMQDSLKRTPLHVAAQNAHATKKLICELAALCPDAISMKTERGHMPLHVAVQSQAKKAVIKALIRLDTYPNGLFIQDHSGNLPLHCATAHQASDDVILFLLKAWPDAASIQNRGQNVPLHYAASHNKSVSVIESLIKASPESIAKLNSRGQSPIDRAKLNRAPQEILDSLEKQLKTIQRKAVNDVFGLDFSNLPKIDGWDVSSLEKNVKTFELKNRANDEFHAEFHNLPQKDGLDVSSTKSTAKKVELKDAANDKFHAFSSNELQKDGLDVSSSESNAKKVELKDAVNDKFHAFSSNSLQKDGLDVPSLKNDVKAFEMKAAANHIFHAFSSDVPQKDGSGAFCTESTAKQVELKEAVNEVFGSGFSNVPQTDGWNDSSSLDMSDLLFT